MNDDEWLAKFTQAGPTERPWLIEHQHRANQLARAEAEAARARDERSNEPHRLQGQTRDRAALHHRGELDQGRNYPPITRGRDEGRQR